MNTAKAWHRHRVRAAVCLTLCRPRGERQIIRQLFASRTPAAAILGTYSGELDAFYHPRDSGLCRTILSERQGSAGKKRGYYNLYDTVLLSCGIGQQILLPFVGGFGLCGLPVVLKHCALFQLPMSAL
ncbi:MAG: hypothetical protein U0787_18740 [Polyangia bacterium]